METLKEETLNLPSYNKDHTLRHSGIAEGVRRDISIGKTVSLKYPRKEMVDHGRSRPKSEIALPEGTTGVVEKLLQDDVAEVMFTAQVNEKPRKHIAKVPYHELLVQSTVGDEKPGETPAQPGEADDGRVGSKEKGLGAEVKGTKEFEFVRRKGTKELSVEENPSSHPR